MIAMPSDGLWGDGSGFLNAGGADAEMWIMEDVPAAAALIAPTMITEPNLFLAGLSMGGYGALRLGAKYAPRVSGISIHSSITHVSQMIDFAEEPLWDYLAAAPEQELDPLHWIMHNRDLLPPLRIDCGTDDRLIAWNGALHEVLAWAGIEHQYFEYEGGHNWSYWKAHIVADSL